MLLRVLLSGTLPKTDLSLLLLSLHHIMTGLMHSSNGISPLVRTYEHAIFHFRFFRCLDDYSSYLIVNTSGGPRPSVCFIVSTSLMPARGSCDIELHNYHSLVLLPRNQ